MWADNKNIIIIICIEYTPQSRLDGSSWVYHCRLYHEPIRTCTLPKKTDARICTALGRHISRARDMVFTAHNRIGKYTMMCIAELYSCAGYGWCHVLSNYERKAQVSTHKWSEYTIHNNSWQRRGRRNRIRTRHEPLALAHTSTQINKTLKVNWVVNIPVIILRISRYYVSAFVLMEIMYSCQTNVYDICTP